MRSNAVAAIALQLPLFAVGSPHVHGHNHAAAHRRALTTEVVVVTETFYQTLTVDPSSTAPGPRPCPTSTNLSITPSYPLANVTKLPDKGVAPIASPSASPPKDTTDNGPYAALLPEAYSAIVKNSCNYPVYITSAGASSCGPGVDCRLVPSNTTYSEKIRVCDHSGISLKVAKTKDMSQPMQFEYTVWDDKKTVSYDMSYLDCMKNDAGQQDLSACAGHDGGIQAASGSDCPTYQCIANEWCDQKAYVVAEFDYKPGAPVGACSIEKGVAFEICAENR